MRYISFQLRVVLLVVLNILINFLKYLSHQLKDKVEYFVIVYLKIHTDLKIIAVENNLILWQVV